MIPRRTVVGAALASPFLGRPGRAQGQARVVVVGGGFGGASCARALRAAGHAVTLVETNPLYASCPMSNHVIAGLRDMDGQRFGYTALQAAGITLVLGRAQAVDAAARQVVVEGGTVLAYDRLVLSPGVEMRFDALQGYTESAAARMPHAWQAGAQTELLRDQLQAMPDGGLVVIAAPATPYRCPPGPYERASLIAHYLKTRKPKSKLLILDAKDQFSKQRLFQQAWAALYPGLLEWVSLSDGGKVSSVDPAGMTVKTDFEDYKPAVANIIPPQRAGRIAATAGVADRTQWCPVDPVSFESRLVPGIHVIGDAAIMGAVPKAAFAANVQGQVCAAAITALLAGRAPEQPRMINACYSLVAPGYAVSVAGVYHPREGQLMEIEGAGGSSPLDASIEFRAQEAMYQDAWFQTITGQVFG